MGQFQNTVLVATNNANKVPEIIENLDLVGWRFLTLPGLGITEAPDETGETYEENALIKARAAWSAAGSTESAERHLQPAAYPVATLADDSGLEVDALGGAPGVHSARYAGEGATGERNIVKLLDELRDVPGDRRGARFVCTIAYIDEAGQEIVSEATCEGMIASAPRGQFGFGYDPVFLPEEIEDGRTMAELTSDEKNHISHRGKALRALRERLLSHYEPLRRLEEGEAQVSRGGCDQCL